PEMEVQANAFASALLMPARDIRSHLSGHLTLPRLAALKPVWRVSMAALLYRAEAIGAITKNQARYLWMQMSAAKIKLREPPELDFPPEEPTVLPTILRLHLDELGYTIADLCKALHVSEEEFRTLYDLPEGPAGRPRMRIVKG